MVIHLSDPRHTECSNLTEIRWDNIYVIKKTMCPTSYHHNGFVVTYALGLMRYGYTMLMNQSAQQAKRGVQYKWPFKLPTTQRMLKSYRSKMGIIYMQL